MYLLSGLQTHDASVSEVSVPGNGLAQEPWEWNYTGFCGQVSGRSGLNSSLKPSKLARFVLYIERPNDVRARLDS